MISSIFKLKQSFNTKLDQYLGEFVYGGIDGSVTTFAVVAGVTGANLESSVVIILGIANLIADGFSMSVGSYLSAKSENEKYKRIEQREYWEIENERESEIDEIREIYIQKGFEGELLEQVVTQITSNNDTWVDIMMKHEKELIPNKTSPFIKGLITFISFVLIGTIPILVYLLDFFGLSIDNLFTYSCILTLLCFLFIGFIKGKITETSKIKGGIETLILGGSAALLSYYLGDILAKLF